LKMKKLLYLSVLLFTGSFLFTACDNEPYVPDICARLSEITGSTIIIDVRNAGELLEDGYNAEFVNIPLPVFPDYIECLRRFETIIIVCRSGSRSGEAVEMLEKHGFTNACNGGAWNDMWECDYEPCEEGPCEKDPCADECLCENPKPTGEYATIGGIRWATRNVGYAGTFVDNPQDFGKLFQWNRINAISATEPATGTFPGWNNSPAQGTEWERENDPCPEGWRVPTRQELQSLFSYPVSRWVLNWNDTGVNGHTYGTAPNQIFMPAVGWRTNTSGTLMQVGGFGRYWSSTPDGTPHQAWHLSFCNTLCHGVFFLHRASALSVRCVKEED